jgi:putative transposase
MDYLERLKTLPRPKKNFSPEFRDEAVKMVIETSRPIAQVEKELGINEGTLGNWVAVYRREHVGEEPPLSMTDRARLREVERENRELKMENDFLKKPQRTSPATIDDREIRVHRRGVCDLPGVLRGTHVPSIVKMCRWMEISRSGFYEWRNAPESATAKRRGELALIIRKSFDDSNETYGYRRVHADLAAWGVPCGPELVRSVMRELGLEP